MNFGDQQSLARAATNLSRAAAAVCAAAGTVVLSGWAFGIEPLLSISPAFATMKVNTAIAFILLSVALWSANFRPGDLSRMRGNRGETLDRVRWICAVLVVLIGLLTLSEYLFGWELGIDNFFVRDHHTVHNPYPGRMSRMSALDFVLLGVAFLTIDCETQTGKRPTQWLAVGVFLDGYIAVLGYVYGVESLYSVGGYASMALHTAIMAVLISAGFLFARPGKGLMFLATDTTAGGWIFRIFLPAAIVITPGLGWFRLRGQQVSFYGLEFGVALMVISNVVLLSSLIWWMAGFVRAEILGRTAIEQKMETDQQQANKQAAILEQRVHERTVELEETVAELERSTYTISHNLRAPIRSILGFSHFLVTDCGDKLSQTGRDYLERIKTSAERMDTLIEGVIRYARVSRSDLNLSPVDLDRLLDDLVADYADGADIHISHPLGTVRANESLVQQAVSNLMENAVKFVQPGTAPQIEVWSKPEDGKLRLVVRDHGIGVPAECGEKIFRSFERAHEGYKGTGIGLAIVKRAVERMDGRVGFDSKPGEGSSFWVELPKMDKTETSDL